MPTHAAGPRYPSVAGQPLNRRSLLRFGAVGVAGTWASTVLAACSGSGSSDSVEGGSGQPIDRLVASVPDLGTQDWRPWVSAGAQDQVVQMIGDTLIRINPKTLGYAGGLAESWTVTPDGKTWTFKLRPNVAFQAGYGTVTTDDVKFTWEQYIRPDSTNGTAPVLFKQAIDGDLNNLKIVSPLEFSVTTSKPVVNLLAYLSINMIIQSRKYWTEKGDAALQHPHGTGPFEFVSSTAGSEVVLKAVANHWRQTPKVQNLVIKVISDPSTALRQVQSGAVDLCVIPAKLIPEAKGSRLKTTSVPDIGSMAIVLGGQFPGDSAHFEADAPWVQADNPDKGLAIRQALSYAIDRSTILAKVLNGAGTLAHGPIAEYPSNRDLVDPSWTLPEYNVEKAKQKLAEGGYPNGFSVTMPLFESRPGDGSIDVGQAVAAMWQAIGITVKLVRSDFTTIRENFKKRSTQGMAYARLSNWFPDAEVSFGSNYMPSAQYAHFYDPAVSDNVPRYDTTVDPQKRDEITRDIVGGLIKDMRCLPMFTVNQTYVTSTKVGSWSPTPSNSELNGLETVTGA
jgi:peptide/nickel transport system substrate-binding protein